jgi:DNA polymerase
MSTMKFPVLYQSGLPLLQQVWNECADCRFGGWATKVWDRGCRFNPDVVILGMAPGQSEEVLGEPFVGPAGKLLDRALSDSGLIQHKLYWMNALLCRPCDYKGGPNRNPTHKELENCSDRWCRQLLVVSPSYAVVTLGKDAEYAWENGRVNGLYQRFQLWHPSYVLRSGGTKSGMYGRYVEEFSNVEQFVRLEKRRRHTNHSRQVHGV